MPGFFSSLRNRVQSVFMTPRQRARATPLEHRTNAMWLERQVTVDSTSVGSNQASATRSGRVPTAGTSLRERSVRQDTTPGVNNFRPPNPIQFAGLRGRELVLRQALHRELDEAVRQGYVKNSFPSVRVGGPGLHSDKTFLEIVAGFNEGMRDLHARFPGLTRDMHAQFPALRGVEPPTLAQYDPNHDEKLCARRDPNYTPTIVRGEYAPRGATLAFAVPADIYSVAAQATDDYEFSPREKGFKGTLVHEYGHHLSSVRVVSRSIWKPKLDEMLKANGLIVGPRGAHASHANDDQFAVLAGKQVRELGIGVYAGSDEFEFVAEAITWRMHPDYGRTEGVPRMPPILESWVHECFPFLDNGRIPQDSVQFNPGSIKEPVSVNGTVEWKRRDVVFPD